MSNLNGTRLKLAAHRSTGVAATAVGSRGKYAGSGGLWHGCNFHRRKSTVIAALIATRSISAGTPYVFLALSINGALFVSGGVVAKFSGEPKPRPPSFVSRNTGAAERGDREVRPSRAHVHSGGRPLREREADT